MLEARSYNGNQFSSFEQEDFAIIFRLKHLRQINWFCFSFDHELMFKNLPNLEEVETGFDTIRYAHPTPRHRVFPWHPKDQAIARCHQAGYAENRPVLPQNHHALCATFQTPRYQGTQREKKRSIGSSRSFLAQNACMCCSLTRICTKVMFSSGACSNNRKWLNGPNSFSWDFWRE